MKKVSLLGIFALLLLNPNLSSAENLGSITIQVKYSNFNTAVFSPDSVYFLVYQDFNSNPFKTVNAPPTNPYTISDLPLGHQYKIEFYDHHVFGGSISINLQSATISSDLIVPTYGGMRLQVLYNDGKPMANTHLAIQSQDKKTWDTLITDSQGYTPQYWYLPSSTEDEYYIANITLAKSISFSYFPINLFPGISRDIQIVTPWPSVVANLITVSVHDGTKILTSNDGNFTVQLYNATGLVDSSNVNDKGFAFFSNLKVDEYNFRALNVTDATKLPMQMGSVNAIINGSQNSVIIHKGNSVPVSTLLRSVSQSCECVAFRLDDIQDWYLRNQQEKVMDIFLEKNASLTVGVIGNYFGKDKLLLSYLQNRTQDKNAPIEIANHGWNHENFATFSEADQSSLINKTNQKLIAIFGEKPVTFLTPYNSLNNDTVRAVLENGMTHISSNAINPYDKPPFPLTNAKLYHFPATAVTAKLSDQGVFVGTTHDYVFQQIKANMDSYGFAVVLMHPQDFSLKVNNTYTGDMDWTQLNELRTLIDEVRNSGLKIVTIGTVNLDVQEPTVRNVDRTIIPEWVRHVALLWEQEKVTDKEFSQGIEYLVKQNIIILKNDTSSYPIVNQISFPQIKDNAGLWGYGQISTHTFAVSLKYLVENNTISP